MTAANPVVPASAVADALRAWRESYGKPTRDMMTAALAAAVPDLIAANTDDTKADALDHHGFSPIVLAIKKHVEHMRGYTLPALSPGFLNGYGHALRLLDRDAGFIAEDILRALRDRADALRTDTKEGNE